MKPTAPLDADGSIKISVGLLARLVSRWIWMVANARAVIDFHSVVFVPHARPAKRNINFAPVYAYVLRPSGNIPCSELFASLGQDHGGFPPPTSQQGWPTWICVCQPEFRGHGI